MAFFATSVFSMVENCADCHICNDAELFVGNIMPLPSTSKVSTIGRGTRLSGIRTVKWTWRDDTGKLHTYKLKKDRYYPDSPVNVLSVIALSHRLKDPLDASIYSNRTFQLLNGTMVVPNELYRIFSAIYQNFHSIKLSLLLSSLLKPLKAILCQNRIAQFCFGWLLRFDSYATSDSTSDGPLTLEKCELLLWH